MKKGGLVVLGLALLVGAAFLVDALWLQGPAPVGEASSAEVLIFPAPQWVAADPVGAQIKLRWRSVPGALAYSLWRSPGPEGKFRVVYMGRDTTFADRQSMAPGETWCYQLTATDPEFDESGFSPSRCVSARRAYQTP